MTLLRGTRGGETRVEFQQDAGKASGSLPKDATKNLKNNLKPKTLIKIPKTITPPRLLLDGG